MDNLGDKANKILKGYGIEYFSICVNDDCDCKYKATGYYRSCYKDEHLVTKQELAFILMKEFRVCLVCMGEEWGASPHMRDDIHAVHKEPEEAIFMAVKQMKGYGI